MIDENKLKAIIDEVMAEHKPKEYEIAFGNKESEQWFNQQVDKRMKEIIRHPYAGK
jgi:Asp-tRNA(Asn)/Glu-tRNA(Gln) amidotransferase B subunit